MTYQKDNTDLFDYDEFTKKILSSLEPPKNLSPVDWANTERYLSPISSAQSGKYSTENIKYVEDILNCAIDPSIVTIVVQKSAQVGSSEALITLLGYYIDQNPCPMMYILPSLNLASDFIKDRVDIMLKETPCLQDKIDYSHFSGNTVYHKTFKGGVLIFAGANSASSLSSRPISKLFLDEVDRFPANVGKDEGDPVNLAIKRTQTFRNRKIFLISTPTVKDHSRIEKAFLESDQRFYHVPCPECNTPHILKWENVHFDEDGILDGAILLCPICGKPISDIARWGQIKLGNWINQKPTLDTAGFHLSELLSPWSTIKKMVQDYLIAKRGGPEFLKTFTNTVLGETSSEDIDIQPTSVFLSRREPFDENTIPTSVNFLVATVDVQDSRLEFCLIGYGLDQETYIIKHLVINGNPFDPKTFDILETQIDKIYSGKQIYVTLIDSGGHATNEVYTFANRMTKKGKRVYAIKGVSGDRPLWPRRSNRSRKYNTQFYPVGVDLAKSIIWDRLKNDVIGPRYIHFSHTLDPVFFEQLQNEIPVYKQIRGGYKKVWELKRKGNEAWDLLVYGVIALYSAITAYERSCFSIDVPEIKVGKSKYLESMREN